ncbi:Hypothetical predicted protein [Mytilus galloprovincialis]|uniref:Uncharacterized protein n=1 Tax=Mytilus galloprovincialis TaxID=29158 RepID=A0A8B6E2L6_MYTGA|nr:Hypothetical predicted protein [Mytilus galloprovincialis]
MSDQFHFALIIPLENKIEIDLLPEDLQISLTERNEITGQVDPVYTFYNNLFEKYQVNKLLFKMPMHPKTIIKNKKGLYMPNSFRRELNALQRNDFLTVNRSSQTLTVKPVIDITQGLLFFQAIELLTPGLIMEMMESMTKNEHYRQPQQKYNGRSTCCFGNIVIVKNKDHHGQTIKFGILPHPECTITISELFLIRNKILKWYCLTEYNNL